ncbi:unnamed protein product [Colias eurytheme]|nr:unnamed protein product [Colias eurytheme]
MDEPEIDLDESLLLGAVDDTVCNICCAEFLDVEDLQTHIVQVHLTEKRKLRFCAECIKIFSDVEKYMTHMLYEHLATLECCKHCYRLFPDMKTKMLHERKHKYRSKKEIFCSQCNECFNDKVFLERHEFDAHLDCEGIMLNHGFPILSSLLNMNVRRFLTSYNEDTTYVCARCQFTTISMEAYLNHIKLTDCKTFACNICLNVYLRKRNLIRHFLSRHGLTDKHNIMECPKCQVMYTRSALQVHEKTCSVLKCLECNISFNSVSDITDHRVRIHQECILVERCRFCSRQVIGQENMQKHIERTHQGTLHLYKYKCVYCDLIFNHPRKLFAHFYSNHKDLQPYTCNICNKNFRIRKNFAKHVRYTHNNVGFLEFNEKFHVSFSAKKSDTSFVPKSIYFNSVEVSDEDENPNITKTKNQEIAMNKNPKIEEGTTDIDAAESKTDKNENKKHVLRKRKAKEISRETDYSSDDSDVPLQKFRKQSELADQRRLISRAPWNATKNKKIKRPQNKFICEKCNKNCYTAQNFQHHKSLHAKNSRKRCIKCDAKFRTESALKEHIEEKHMNSTLTDTLKKILERQKQQSVKNKEEISRQNRFKVSIKKVVCVDSETSATMTRVTDSANKSKKVSVKNFIENFMPDHDGVRVKDCVTMKVTNNIKPPTITLKRCDLREVNYTRGLKKPVPFKYTKTEHSKVDVKLVYREAKRANLNYGDKLCTLYKPTTVLNEDHAYCDEYQHNDFDNIIDEDTNNDYTNNDYTNNDYTNNDYTNNDYTNNDYTNNDYTNDDDYTNDFKTQQIPDVAEEVMLATEEVKPHNTITVSSVPNEYKSIRIGTLQSQAPYYKILKIDDILNSEKKEEIQEDGKYVNLPDGTQLVPVNPLAHLIDAEGLKKKMPKKYYKPKKKDIGEAISKFLTSTPHKRSRKRSSKKK